MNILSLFDGQSCGFLAAKEAGLVIDNYFASEVEEDVIEVSKINNPEIIHIGDVTKWREWNLPKIDLVIGGSPCQGFSRSGLGLNFEDPRSKLFFEFVDIVNHYREINPDIRFMLENVNMKKEWENVISEYLGVTPIQINSDLLLPHNRPRTYWANFEIELPEQVDYKLLDYLDDVVLEECDNIGDMKVCNSFSDASIELITIGRNGVRIAQSVKVGYAIAEPGDGINISFPTSKSRRGRVIKNRSSCIDTACNIGVYDQKSQIRRFTINELERLQGMPIGYTSTMKPSAAKKALGNGWTVPVIAHIFKGLK